MRVCGRESLGTLLLGIEIDTTETVDSSMEVPQKVGSLLLDLPQGSEASTCGACCTGVHTGLALVPIQK